MVEKTTARRLRALLILAIVALFASCHGGGGALPPLAKSRHAFSNSVAPSVAQWSSGAVYAPSSVTVSWPAAPAVGDVLVVALWNNGQSSGAANSYSAPAGWTLADQNLSGSYATYQLYSHVVGAGESNAYVFTPSASQREHAWIAADVTGAAGIDVAADNAVSNSTGFTTPTVTPSQVPDLALALNLPMVTSSPTWTNPSGWSPGTGPSSTWSGESLVQALSSTAPVSAASTLSAAASGFSAVVLLAPSSAQPTPSPTAPPSGGSPPAIVQWTNSSSYAPSSIAVSWPSPPAAGDVLVVAFLNNGQSSGAANTYSPPAGWTLVDQNTSQFYASYQAFAHVVGPGENNSYIFAPLAAQREHVWIGVDLRGAGGVDKVANAYVSSGTSYTTPSLTPSQSSDTAIAFDLSIAPSGATWANPAGWNFGSGPTSPWQGQALYQQLSSPSPLTAASTLSTAANGFAALILVSTSGSIATATPPPTPTPTPVTTPTPGGGGGGGTPAQWTDGASYAPASITVSWPSSPASGDVLVAAFWNNGQSSGAANTYTAPAGWTLVDQNTATYATYQVFTHVVAPTDGNAYTFTPASAAREHLWIGLDAAGVTGVDKGGDRFVNGTAFTTPSLTPTQSGDLAVAFSLPITTAGISWTNPAGWTLGAGPTGTWRGEAQYQTLASASAISENSTLSSAAAGFAGLVLLTSAATATPTPAPTATPVPVDWSTFGYDLQRTGYNPSENTIGSARFATLHSLWSTLPNVGNFTQGEPVLAMGVTVNGASRNLLYAGGGSGIFYALDADTGAVVWSKQLGTGSYTCPDTGVTTQMGIEATAALDRPRNRIYVPDGANQVHALDLSTGAEASGWPIAIAAVTGHDFIHAALNYNAADNMLYAETSSTCDISPWYGRIAAINAATGALVNTFYPTQGTSGGGIWGFGGAAIDPSNNNVFVAVGNADSSVETAYYAEQIVELSPDLSTVVADNYPSGMPTMPDSDFGATPLLFQPIGCNPLLAAMNKSGAFVLYDRTNITAGPTQMLVLAPSDGSANFRGVPAYDPVTNYLYVEIPTNYSTYQPGVVAFSISPACTLNPTPVWNAAFGPSGSVRSPITIANGVLYVSDGTGQTTYAFDAASGAKIWSAPLSDRGLIGPVVASGRLYVSDEGGTVRAWVP